MTTTTTTYTQFAARCHEVGGETQTEATAKIGRLGSRKTVFLNALMDGLRREAAMCTTDAEYAPVRAQMDRIRPILLRRIR